MTNNEIRKLKQAALASHIRRCPTPTCPTQDNVKIYGKSASGNYAVSLPGDQVWRAVEVVQDRYFPLPFDAIPECDWDRIEVLEQRLL